jgi:hypothetical protein
MVYAATLAAQGATMLLGGVVSQSIGARTTCLLGGFVIVSGAFLASSSTTAAQMIFCQGILLGIGIGLCYTAPISAAVRWMPNRKGLVTGIIVGGFGCGAFIFGLLATSIVNPDHLSVNHQGDDKNYFSPDSSVVANVPTMFRVLGFTYFCFLLTGCMLLVEPPISSSPPVHTAIAPVPSEQQKFRQRKSFSGSKGVYMATAISEDANDSSPENEIQYSVGNPMMTKDDIEMTSFGTNNNVEVVSDKEEEKSMIHEVNIGPRELIMSPLAWHVASCFITTTVGGMYVAGTFKVFGQSHFSDEVFLSTISSVASIFNSSGRIVWGYIADQIGALKTLAVLSFIFAVVLMTYPSSVELGQGGFALWTFMIFFFEGANFVLYVPVTVLLFGAKNSASNYGLIFTSYSLFTVINIFMLADAGVPFPKACTMMGLLTTVGFLNLILLYFHIKFSNNKRIVGWTLCKWG